MIRDLAERDLPQLRAAHAAMGMQFDFPEPPYISAKVWVDTEDRPLLLITARPMAEATLVMAGEGTPGMRLAALAALGKSVEMDCRRAGVSVGVCWIPDGIWKAYSRRLKALGWLESKYRTMCLMLNEERG